MYTPEAREEYQLAFKSGLREYKELGCHPAVLDALLPEGMSDRYVDVGLTEIPADRIIGTKSAGRITAFSPSFYPLLEPGTEFAAKWVELCAAHLGTEGIRDPILCYEYLGNFYVQEGNKRVSVLRHFGAPRIPGIVRRVMPETSDEPEVMAYMEFLEFFKDSHLYEPRYTTPGSYEKLMRALGREPGVPWDQWEKRTFCAYLQYFRDAYATAGKKADIRWEDALLLWLDVYSFRDIGRLSATELNHTVEKLWQDLDAIAEEQPIAVSMEPAEKATSMVGLLKSLIQPAPEVLQVAFVHTMDTETSAWVKGHDVGREHLEKALGEQVRCRSYFHAGTPQEADRLLALAVEEGADLVFTTAPQLARATTRAAIAYPKVRFFNCSVDVPYSSIRAYYSRMYEAKFITGAIAGAMADEDSIGYLGNYPIYGVPASINAFALGAQMTNPRAKVQLRWSCLPGSPLSDFISMGCEVISNRDVPTRGQSFAEHGAYGTYFISKDKEMVPLASPIWLWGSFYEKVAREVLEGKWEQGVDRHKALSYWWGMDSGVIDVDLSPNLPDSVQYLAKVLRQGLKDRTIDPFARRIVAQDGSVKNDGTHSFTPDQLLRMDWLCENVEGHIPEFEEVLPIAQATVRQLGLHRERIPKEREVDSL